MESQHSAKSALIKVLSIVGLFALLVLLLWLIVQGIRVLPNAFSSLANIAQTVNNYRPADDLTIVLPKDIVNSEEIFTVTWNDMGKGSYYFTYACEDGVRLSVRTGEGGFQEIPCTETLTLSEDVLGLFIAISSKEQRFSDIAMELTFEALNEEAVTKEWNVTVVNATVPQGGTQVAEEPKDEPEPKPTPTTPVAPKPTPKPTPVTPVVPVLPTYVTYYPVSIPTGYTDLRITFLHTGVVKNGIFIPQTSFDEDDRAAFQFEVKNIGTKTSEGWSYELELPGGEDHESRNQSGLLPQERAVFTVEFNLRDSSRHTVTIEGSIDTDEDTNSRNDSFEKTVRVEN